MTEEEENRIVSIPVAYSVHDNLEQTIMNMQSEFVDMRARMDRLQDCINNFYRDLLGCDFD